MTERGAGRLKGALGQVKSRTGSSSADSANATDAAMVGGQGQRMVRRRRRAKTGKRSRTEEYGQANGLVRREVLGRWEQAKADPAVRQTLETELTEAGVEFKKGDPDFGAVCELLLGEWLESVGYG